MRGYPSVVLAVLVLLHPPLALEEAGAAGKIAGTLSVRDALTAPGRPVRIEARLVRDGIVGQTGLGGEQLELTVEGKKAGTAMTGGDGRAFFEYIPRRRGNFIVKVRLAASHRVESAEASATVACWERRRPMLLVEVVALTEETKAPLVPLPSFPLEIGRRDDPIPAPDAADELKRLAQFYFNVIYVSRSGRDEMGGTRDIREWLQEHRFPNGFSMPVPSGQTSLASKIEELRAEGWNNLKAGIGRTREFAEVLADHRMEVILVADSNRKGDLPKRVRVAEDWKDVRRKLQR